MTQINEQADGIVLGLKAIPALSSVRFVREYSSEPIETPVSGFIAAVGVNSAERKNGFIGGDATSALKGEMYSASIEIRLYSPNGGNGSVYGAYKNGTSTKAYAATPGAIASLTTSSIGYSESSLYLV